MNYKIIEDADKLREFIEWLPELKETEKYYLCLFARSKYCKELTHIKSDKSQLKRLTSDKARMFDKIWQLETEVGSYKQYKKDDDKTIAIPQEALALYITPNPREMWKATFNSLIKLSQCIRDQNVLVNPYQEVMSEIQRTKSRSCFVDFDIDEVDEDKLKTIIQSIYTHINPSAVNLLRTRGGMHVLVDPNKVEYEYRNKWYLGIKNLGVADQTGDQMIPVPGTYQGGFIPHFINVTKNEDLSPEGVTDKGSDQILNGLPL